MTKLLGLIDDPDLAGYSTEATDLLQRPRNMFSLEFRARDPSAWDENPSNFYGKLSA